MPLDKSFRLRHVIKVPSSVYPTLERHPGKQNWIDYAGGLPSYIERIAKHLHYEKGHSIGQSIAIAVGICRDWASGRHNVDPDTRAKAAKAIAEWEAKKKAGGLAMRAANEAKRATSKRKPKLGSGARFKKLKAQLAAQGVEDPAALAAHIGRKKYGPKKFAKLGAKAKKAEPMSQHLYVPGPMGKCKKCGGPKGHEAHVRLKKSEPEVEVEASGAISKIDKAQQIVFGWAYVTHKADGALNVDKSGEFVDSIDELEKTAYDFVLKSRQGDAYHDNQAKSTMVESVVFTPEKVAKMGLPEGIIPNAWWVGFKVHDPQAWSEVESGRLTSFSVHGKALKKDVSNAA